MYFWILCVGGFFCFITAMGIGSNDAANAFSTSVGSKSLTFKQATVLAIIFETSGAILMGNHVSDTIRKGISDIECFEDNPEALMYGCMWVLVSVSGWLFLASYYELPVSTTHSCVGGMIGMTIAIVGSDCVIWYSYTDKFPYIGGVSGIVLSWFISPIFSGLISCGIFSSLRSFVLRKPYTSNRIIIFYPCLVSITLLINCFFIIYKGAKGIGLHNLSLIESLGYSFGISIFGGLITIPLVPYIKKMVDNKFNTNNITEEGIIDNVVYNNDSIENNTIELNIKNNSQLKTITYIHDNAEKFDDKLEETFKYLQIFSAICDSFSHGANDVANAVGPFFTIYLIYTSDTKITKKVDMGEDAYWILSLGGLGISMGLLLYGKKIINALGTKLCKITASRGTCIELGSALVIITGSRLKIPLSTTHCQVGATVGVGLLEKNIHGINWFIILKTVSGWLSTCIIVGFTTGILVSQGIYAPSLINE
tara:strand:+ start:68 stop:1510 length:1443 start_codon:yes stop_codon:yes gene_type:complete